ncbi:MAG: hypothetical protein ACTSVA_02635 [Candidatus Njordarchaeales archaeon]
MEYAVISAKIPKDLKEEIDRLGIKVSEVVRKALMEEVRRRKLEMIKKHRMRLREVLDKIPDNRVIEIIREFRGEL